MVDWKYQDLYEMLHTALTKFYNPCEAVAEDEIIVLFIGRSVSRQVPS
jgi:hypothetical protein